MLSISKVIAILRIVALLRRRKKKSGRFLRLVRFYRKEFDYLVEMLGNRLEPASNNKSMKTPEKLFLTLIYLSSGQSIASLSRSLKWSPSTCRTVIKDTCEALWTVLKAEYMPLPTESMHRKVADRFWQLYQLPNTIGTLMGKNIAIVKPRDSGGLYYNHKGFCSFVLLATCDADFRFTMIDVGAYGSQSAESVLRNAHFGRRLFAGNLSIPAASTLPVMRGDAEEAPLINYAYIGDATMPLARNIIRPFATPTEAHEEHFNYRLERPIRKTERAFGLLTNSWRVLRKPITFEPETAIRITLACVMLHNFLRYLSSRTPVDNTVEEHVLHGLEPREVYEGEGETSPSQVQNRLLLSRYLYRNRKVHLNRED